MSETESQTTSFAFKWIFSCISSPWLSTDNHRWSAYKPEKVITRGSNKSTLLQTNSRRHQWKFSAILQSHRSLQLAEGVTLRLWIGADEKHRVRPELHWRWFYPWPLNCIQDHSASQTASQPSDIWGSQSLLRLSLRFPHCCPFSCTVIVLLHCKVELEGHISQTMNIVIRSTRESRDVRFSKLNTKPNYATIEKVVV